MSTVKLVNTYAPPAQAAPDLEELLHPASGTHDVNFCFPVRELESDKVKLVPWVPHIHMPLYQQRTLAHPELFTYVGMGPFADLAAACTWYELAIRRDPGATWFAVVDKTRADDSGLGLGGRFAGDIGLLGGSVGQSQCEVGYIMYLPEFQRSHVNSHAVGLLLGWLLDPPSKGGLGLRRAQWKANADNGPSVRAARRLGFRDEGVLRWHMVLPAGKVGPRPGEERDGVQGPGRHTAMLSICWDDWEGGVREHVRGLMY